MIDEMPSHTSQYNDIQEASGEDSIAGYAKNRTESGRLEKNPHPASGRQDSISKGGRPWKSRQAGFRLLFKGGTGLGRLGRAA